MIDIVPVIFFTKKKLNNMNRRKRSLIIVISLTMLVIGLLILIQNKIEEGDITEKKYQKAYSSFEMQPSANGMSPQLVHHPESWSVIITNQTDSRLCMVNKTVWDTIEVGDWV
jgi:hypothetical protein